MVITVFQFSACASDFHRLVGGAHSNWGEQMHTAVIIRLTSGTESLALVKFSKFHQNFISNFMTFRLLYCRPRDSRRSNQLYSSTKHLNLLFIIPKIYGSVDSVIIERTIAIAIKIIPSPVFIDPSDMCRTTNSCFVLPNNGKGKQSRANMLHLHSQIK